MYKYGKKLCAFLLTLCMIIGFLPMHAFAIEIADYITQSMVLGEDLVLHLWGDVPSIVTLKTATLTYGGQSYVQNADEIDRTESGTYHLWAEMAVPQMTEQITLDLSATALGSTQSGSATYTVRDYLITLIEGDYNQATKDLALELLNMGAWAQKYFDVNADNLANKGYDITPANAVPETVPVVSMTGSVPGVWFYGTSVRFLSKTAVRFYFQAKNGVDGYTFAVDGVEYEPVEKDGLYYIEVGGINPQQMSDQKVATVTDGANTQTVEYTPINYFIRNYHSTTDETFKSLMAAAYSYFKEAEYFTGVSTVMDLSVSAASGSANALTVTTNLASGLSLSSWSANEDANAHKASSVTVADAAITFNFADNYVAGQTYSLPKGAYFSFTDGSEYCLVQDYLFQFDGTVWSMVEKTGNMKDGVGFENAGNALLFTGLGPNTKAATVERVAYADLDISAPADGGSYGLKLSHATSYWPTFTMDFGTELAAGTVVSFMAYGRITEGTSSYNKSIFEFNDGGEIGEEFACDQWTKLSFTLTEAASSVDLFWNIDRAGITSTTASAEVYVDNFVAKEPIDPTGDFLEGIGFEVEGNAERFTGIGATQDATIEQAAYADLSITAPENSGDYVLKMSHASHYYPTFQMNFGQTLKAGTTITFQVYGTFDGWQSGNDMNIEFTGDSGSGQVVYMIPETWFTASITLDEDRDHLQFFWNIERGNGISGDVASTFYIDNVLAVEPAIEPTGDFLEGIGFEVEGNAERFTGIGASQDATIEQAAYADLSITAPENSGDYVLKMSHASHYYPTFQMNFGQTLKAGTTITFQVYGTFDGWQSGNDMNIEFTGDSGSGQVVYMVPDAWFTASITLTEDRDHLQFFWNIERGNGISGDVASCIYIDNVLAVEPPAEPTGDILAGIDFETEGNELRFTGIGYDQDATVERAAYADLSISGPANCGDYAAKLSHTSHYYPTFQLNFGQTLKAGTTITFDVYGTFDGWQSGNDMNIEFTGDSGSGQVVYMIPDAWFTVSITLTEDRDHLQFFWNIERGNGISGDVASCIYIDNVKAVEPIPTIVDGFTFENDTDATYFTGVGGDNAWRDATFEVVSFDGDNALKLTCASSQWPTFRINFGQTLTTGTQICFEAYTNDTSGIRNTVSIFEPIANCTETEQYYHGSWNTLTITLTADCDYVDLMCNMDRWNESGSANIEVYIDNMIVIESFSAGVDFEGLYDARFFGGVGGDNEWRDASFEVVSFDGDNALKLTCASSQWPTFRISFGETLSAGTTITFEAYTNDTSGIRNTVSIFEPIANCGETAQYYHGSWNTLTITLTADCEYVDLMCNMDRWNEPGPANIEVYMDNFVVDPA